MKRSRIRRYVGLERKAWLRPKRKSAVTREFQDKTTGEWRLILSEADWRTMKRGMWAKRGKALLCGICGLEILRFKDLEPDHEKPRGMNGGFRNDVATNLRPAHKLCNREKGSQRNFTLRRTA